MTTNQTVMTAEDLLASGDIGRCELIQGELVHMSPGGSTHGAVAFEIGWLLGSHVKRKRLGQLWAAETGFRIAQNPDTVRAPDVAFVSVDRLSVLPPRGFFEGAPDLAVEVISPDDRWSEVAAKANAWLEAGTQLVWVIDPPNRTVTIYAQSADVRVLRETDTLDGGEVVPGFQVRVSEIFPTL